MVSIQNDPKEKKERADGAGLVYLLFSHMFACDPHAPIHP